MVHAVTLSTGCISSFTHWEENCHWPWNLKESNLCLQPIQQAWWHDVPHLNTYWRKIPALQQVPNGAVTKASHPGCFSFGHQPAAFTGEHQWTPKALLYFKLRACCVIQQHPNSLFLWCHCYNYIPCRIRQVLFFHSSVNLCPFSCVQSVTTEQSPRRHIKSSTNHSQGLCWSFSQRELLQLPLRQIVHVTT